MDTFRVIYLSLEERNHCKTQTMRCCCIASMVSVKLATRLQDLQLLTIHRYPIFRNYKLYEFEKSIVPIKSWIIKNRPIISQL